MPVEYIDRLLRVFKVLAFFCFIATGAMTTGAVYALLVRYFPERFEGKSWPFVPIAIVVYMILLYIYNLLF